MTPQELKNSILQMAIQGKLVEQRAEEGTAQELLDKLPKPKKTLSEIEEDEIPFEIPSTWKWVRLGECGSFTRGNGIKRGEVIETGLPCVRYGQLYTTYKTKFSQAVSFIPPALFDKCQKAVCGDVLMALTGENNFDIALAVAYEGVETLAIGGDMTKFSSEILSPLYLVYTFNSPYAISCKSKLATGNIIVHISNDKLGSIPIPVPPLAEQHRIVAKIDSLLPLIDRYEKAWSRLEEFNKRFPGDMQKSLLQLAIQGKLVEQRSEEGTGEELYQQIQQEKARLVKEDKIKKEKPLPDITDDDIPFEVPETWKWVRLGYLTEMITSGSRDWAQYYSESGDKFIRMGNLSRGSFHMRLDKMQYVSLPDKAEGQRTSLQENDLLFSITAEIGMLGLIPANFGKAYINQHTAMIRFLELIRGRYIPYILQSDYAQKFYNGNQHGIKHSFRLDSIALLPIPLPPLAEQNRIVTRLEEMLPLCERLK